MVRFLTVPPQHNTTASRLCFSFKPGVIRLISQATECNMILPRYENTERRAAAVGKKGLGYLGMGVSGGEEGARNGMLPLTRTLCKKKKMFGCGVRLVSNGREDKRGEGEGLGVFCDPIPAKNVYKRLVDCILHIVSIKHSSSISILSFHRPTQFASSSPLR